MAVVLGTPAQLGSAQNKTSAASWNGTLTTAPTVGRTLAVFVVWNGTPTGTISLTFGGTSLNQKQLTTFDSFTVALYTGAVTSTTTAWSMSWTTSIAAKVMACYELIGATGNLANISVKSNGNWVDWTGVGGEPFTMTAGNLGFLFTGRFGTTADGYSGDTNAGTWLPGGGAWISDISTSGQGATTNVRLNTQYHPVPSNVAKQWGPSTAGSRSTTGYYLEFEASGEAPPPDTTRFMSFFPL